MATYWILLISLACSGAVHCQLMDATHPGMMSTPVTDPGPGDRVVQKILYSIDDDGSAVAEAQAMISAHHEEAEGLSSIAEVPEEKSSSETPKRKSFVKLDFDAAGIANLSLREKTFRHIQCSL